MVIANLADVNIRILLKSEAYEGGNDIFRVIICFSNTVVVLSCWKIVSVNMYIR